MTLALLDQTQQHPAGAAPPDEPPTPVDWHEADRRGLKTRPQWLRELRKVLPGARPAFAAGRNRIPVYSAAQTREYRPKPATVAFHEDADRFLEFVNPDRRPHSYGYKPRRDFESPGWPEAAWYLANGLWRDALRHREALAVRSPGDFSRWYALDIDFHDAEGDWDRFIAQVRAVYGLLAELGEDFFLACRTRGISGVHFWVFCRDPFPYRQVMAEAAKVKAELIRRHPDLFDHRLELYPQRSHNFRIPICPTRCPVVDVPLHDLGPREQLSRLLRFIDHPTGPMPLDDLVEWLGERRPGRRRSPAVVPRPAEREEPPSCHEGESPPCSADAFLAELEASLAEIASRYPERPPDLPGYDIVCNLPAAQWRPIWNLRHEIGMEAVNARLDELLAASSPPGASPRATDPEPRKDSPLAASPRAGEGLPEPVSEAAATKRLKEPEAEAVVVPAGSEPVGTVAGKSRGLWNGWLDEFLDQGRLPRGRTPHMLTVGHARLCARLGKPADAFLDFYLSRIVGRADLASSRTFSDAALFRRKYARIYRRIQRDNGYQKNPESSSLIMGRWAQGFRSQGLDPLDPKSFCRYRAGTGMVLGEVAELGFCEKLRIKEHLGWLSDDVQVVYRAAAVVKGWLRANPGKPLAASFLPRLCQGLEIDWRIDARGRSRVAERVLLHGLPAAGVLKVTQKHVFRGRWNPNNRGHGYEVLEQVADAWRPLPGVAVKEQEEEGIYSRAGGPAPAGVLDAMSRHVLRRTRWLRGPPRLAA